MVMRCSLLGALTLLAACGPQAPSSSDAAPPATVTEVPAKLLSAGSQMTVELGAAKLVVELSVDNPRPMLSEPSYAQVAFRGTRGVEVEMKRMGRNELGRPSNYELAFVNASGEALPVPDAGMELGGQSWVAKIDDDPPTQRLFLPHWVVGLSPGSYTLTARTTVRARADASAPWEYVAVALATPIEVILDDEVALAALIDEIARAAKSDDWDASHEAIERLAAIDDEARTLEHWLEIIALPDYERRFAAIRELVTMADERAFAAVVRASQTMPDELPLDRYASEELRAESAGQLRLVAAQALARSDRPEALGAVLALRDDPHDSVRLIVCQRAAKLDGVRGLAILDRMARDSSALVRGEAERFLRARGIEP